MFIKTIIVESQFCRESKLGKTHYYSRKKIVAILRCDCCDHEFHRDLKHIDRKRLNNNYFHCCFLCDSKRFAQKKSVERKKVWDLLASVDLPVSKY